MYFKDFLIFFALLILLLFNYILSPGHLLLYLFFIIFFSYFFISIYVSHKYGARILGWEAVLKYRDYTSILINLAQICIIFNLIFVLYNESFNPILAGFGFVVMFIGMGFNIQVRRELGKNWVPLSKTTEGQELVTTGIYSKIRHPFYTSILILFLGVSIIAGNFYSLIFTILFIISLLIRIRKEEEELITKFGDEYIKYKKETSAMFPKF
jgi:protein-S-isoprenylcysteine O-methyltransferase Ste14